MKTKTFITLFMLPLLMACGGEQNTNETETEEGTESLSHEQALTILQATYEHAHTGRHERSATNLFDRDGVYPIYCEKISHLANLGLINRETKQFPRYVETRITLTPLGLEKYAAAKDKPYIVYIANDSITGIMGISLSEDGNSAQVKFSITQNETPFMNITSKRSLEGYEKNRRDSKTAHFVKYDTGWVCESTEGEDH